VRILDSNYEQLGLKFKLYAAEVLFNKGLSLIYMGNTEEGIEDMRAAQRDKQTVEHNVIDDAIRDQGEGYTVFSIVSAFEVWLLIETKLVWCGNLACWGVVPTVGE
jgi:hypothetical protein